MADVLDILKNKLANIPIPEMMQRITERNKAAIEDKNIKQMEAGLDVEGNPIDPPYTAVTVAFKKAMGQVFDHVTLHNEGNFYKGTKATALTQGIEMSNTDSKWGKLTEKYGDVIGLTEQSEGELREEVYLPGLIEEAHDYFDHG